MSVDLHPSGRVFHERLSVRYWRCPRSHFPVSGVAVRLVSGIHADSEAKSNLIARCDKFDIWDAYRKRVSPPVCYIRSKRGHDRVETGLPALFLEGLGIEATLRPADSGLQRSASGYSGGFEFAIRKRQRRGHANKLVLPTSPRHRFFSPWDSPE